MSANLNVYKTLFVKPDQKSRSVTINSQVAYACIFKPLDTTLEEVRVLMNIGRTSGATNPAITYHMAIVQIGSTPISPSLAIDLNNISSQDGYSYVTINTAAAGSKAWITFKPKTIHNDGNYLLSGIDTSKYYAIIIMSDAPFSDTDYANNGVIYSEIPFQYNDHIFKSYVMVNSEWTERRFGNSPISANIFMYGGSINNTNENSLDLGSTTTSGTSCNRGYEIFLTVKNEENASPATDLVMVANPEATSNLEIPNVSLETYKYESYLAPGQWLRFEPEYLPFDESDFNDSLYSANMGATLLPGQIIVFTQRDRIYPYPKFYINIEQSSETLGKDGTINGDTTFDESNILDPNAIIIYAKTGIGSDVANLSIRKKSGTDFKKSIIREENSFKNASGTILQSGTQSELIGKKIRRFKYDHPNHGFQITDHIDAKNIEVEGRRLYPYFLNINQDENNLNATIDGLQASTLTSVETLVAAQKIGDVDLLPFFLNGAATRLQDSSNVANSGTLTTSRIFALSTDGLETAMEDGDFITAPSNQVPYLLVYNVKSESTGVGNSMDSLGFVLHTGRATTNYHSVIVPETSDFEAMSRAGYTDIGEFFGSTISTTGSANNAQGLLLFQHRISCRQGKVFLLALVVRKINKNGIITFGQCVASGGFTKVLNRSAYINGQFINLLDITIPYHNFTTAHDNFFKNHQYWFLPRPFHNRYYGSGSLNSSFEIVGASGHTLTVKGTLTGANGLLYASGMTKNPNDDVLASQITSATDEKSFYIVNFGDFIQGYQGYGYGYAYGLGKFDTPPSADFFILFSDLQYEGMYGYAYGAGYGLFMGQPLAQYQSGANTWLGITPIPVGTGGWLDISSVKYPKIFMFEATQETYANKEMTFFNQHNLKHIMDHIDKYNDTVEFGFCTTETANKIAVPGGEDLFQLTSDKNLAKSRLQTLWNLIGAGTPPVGDGTISPTNYYKAMWELGRRIPINNSHVLLFACDNIDKTATNSDIYKMEALYTHNFGRVHNPQLPGEENAVIELGADNNADAEFIHRYVSGEGGEVEVVPNGERYYGSAYIKVFKIYPAHSPNMNDSAIERINKVNGLSNYYKYALFAGTINTPYILPKTSFGGWQLVSKVNTNLVDGLDTEMIGGDGASQLFVYSNLKEYSLVVPFTISDHQKSLEEFCGTLSNVKNPDFISNTVKKYINLDKTNIYEVIDHTASMWSDNNISYDEATGKYIEKNKEFYIYESHNSPSNARNANLNIKSNYTTFSFINPSSLDEINLSDRKSLSIDLGIDTKYNTITFAYKISYPNNLPLNSITKVKLNIQASSTETFYSEETDTLFDGIVDITPDGISSTTVSDMVLKINSFILPDGFQLFILDLNQTYSADKGRYLRIFFDKYADSVSQEVSLSKLRIYNKVSERKLAYGYGYGGVSNDFFDVFFKEGNQFGYFTTIGGYVPSLPTYNYGYGFEYMPSDVIIPSIFGTMSDCQSIITQNGATFSYNNDYVVIDLGKETPIRNIKFTIKANIIPTNTISISYKSFTIGKNNEEKFLLSDVSIADRIGFNNYYDEILQTNFFARLIIIRTKGSGSFKINNFSVGIGNIMDLYKTDDFNKLASNYEFGIYDEDIRFAPKSRVAIMSSDLANSRNKYLGIKIDRNTPKSITQLSFAMYPDNSNISPTDNGSNNLFILQKYSNPINPSGILTNDLNWVTLVDTIVGKYYDRIPYESQSFLKLSDNGIGLDGITISIDNEAVASRAANNGLVNSGPYVLRIPAVNDLLLRVIESSSDGNNAYLKLNANLRDLNINNNSEFFLERLVIVPFDATEVTALQIIKVAGPPLRINGIKAYTNLLKTDGTIVSPTTNSDIAWIMSLNSE